MEIPKPTLAAVEDAVQRLARKIGALSDALPTFGRSEQSGRPHIEVIGKTYHFVSAERGTEFSREKTTEIEELLFWIFSSVTFEMAVKYELAHRIKGQDFRRLLFQKQFELLRALNSAWAVRMEKEKEQILLDHPFVDNQ